MPYDRPTGGSLSSEATRDESDLRRANRLVLYVPEPDTSLGGRDTELGMALAMGHSPIHLIGRPKQVFHYHPAVTVYPTLRAWEEEEW